jgi:hypothetical protein
MRGGMITKLFFGTMVVASIVVGFGHWSLKLGGSA